MTGAIDVAGLEAAVRAFTRAAEDLDSPGRATERTARVLLDEGNRRVPRRTGRLAHSGRVERGSVAYGNASVPYALPVHFGVPRRNMRSQPWLAQTRGDTGTQARVLDVWQEELQDFIDSFGG